MLPEGITARSHRRLTAVRAARLIDALIDQAHRDWPDAGFVIGLPSGEDVFLPAHRSGGTPCPLGHAGYFRDRVRPFCEVDPTLHAGICRITPVALDQDPPTAHAYQLSLSSGTITATGQPTAAPQRPVIAPITTGQPSDPTCRRVARYRSMRTSIIQMLQAPSLQRRAHLRGP